MKRTELQRLATLYFTTRQIIRSQLPQGNVDPNEWLRFETLRFIAAVKGPSMRDIAAYVRITAPSATSLVRHLEGRGLVRVHVGAGDKRSKRVVLTSRGRVALKHYERRSERVLSKVFSHLSRAELAELLRLLQQVADAHEG